jgi:membrane-associated phospholipid phosphatase
MRLSVQRWREYITWRLITILGIVLFCLWLFAIIQEGITGEYWIVKFDLELANALHAGQTSLSTNFFKLMSLLGYESAWLVTIVVAVYFGFKREKWKLAFWLFAIFMGELLNFILKNLYDRPRPVFLEPLAIATHASFPSGHAMKALIVYGMLAYFLMLNITNPRLRIVIVFIVALLSVLVGISRLYLGVHYFSDVVGGFAVGGIWLTACIVAAEFIRHRWKAAVPPV